MRDSSRIVPAGHNMQSTELGESWYFPAEQIKHPVCSVFLLYLPLAHCLQTAVPDVLANKPALHARHEVLLVLDSNTGQNAIFQTREFLEVADLTGLVITKLDGTSKGGVVIGIVNEFDIPVRYIGLGEQVEDLRPFDAKQFTESLFA